ncbi:glycoside hydrolase [Rhodococcus sp. 06-412-2C]|uniref:glycoside hydrolase family 16 protein n=1 Tax=unclassified Rhodococcus (in: high G+C Gram-positive bacteria) TaxID=192944 RepID=UPI000B9B1A8D|nr:MULTISPECIES: glycoside hydrolase family 16 protein [unclassified Rhodococcus (in: high G+C Gram-positive bacteria)]OZC83546.1 glycoside hydrolase [Rhodococcus sp. 06-412-2C]OZC93730.1 glycoside hydrolase [Rhodococcus sp. 06-412-2B]
MRSLSTLAAVTLTTLAVAVSSATAAPALAAPPRTQGGAGTLLWEDQFNGYGGPDPSKWGFQTGRWGASSGEQQYYTNAWNNANQFNGTLNITARRETPPDGKGAPNNFTSARVVSMGKQSATPPVRIEASIKMPSAQGLLPAFWTLGLQPGGEYSWPSQGEIDAVEIPGLNGPSFNLHGPSKWNSSQDVKTGGGMGPVGNGFHTYRIDWLPTSITWFVDGVARYSLTKAQYEAKGGNWKAFSGAWPHYILLNVAVGNNWVGKTPTSTPYPQTMSVDWIRVSRL